VKDLFRELAAQWEKTSPPQYQVEETVRLLMNRIKTARPGMFGEQEGLEFLIDDAFYYATDYADLLQSLLYILDKFFPDEYAVKADSREFFNLITAYIDSHLAENLSLQHLCVHFGISQTYMSRLFRKYTGASFVSYLTGTRVERAKELLSGGATLIKDAAAMTGFSSQLYFSKVFKTVTGLTPSAYCQGLCSK